MSPIFLCLCKVHLKPKQGGHKKTRFVLMAAHIVNPSVPKSEIVKKESDPEKKKRGAPSVFGEWTSFAKEFIERNPELQSKKQSEKFRLAGIAWRHKHNKPREDDPPKPEFL